MNFQPEKITREHILKAIQEIDKGEIGLRVSTKYDIHFEGRTYPPKDTMRLAHEYATGKYLWERNGGEPTNKYLQALGFEVRNKEFKRYDWTETHKEICNYLSTKQNNQEELVQLLKDVGINVQNDKSSPEHSIPLKEIDPFTFFCHIYKHGTSKRLEMLQKVAVALNIKKPTDESGIPSANAQKTWLFPYKYDRTYNEINTLWGLFHMTLDGSLDEVRFSKSLAISGVGKTKLTESLFTVKPLSYFPLNGPSKPYIKEVFSIDPEFNSLEEYLSILGQIKKKTDKSFPELSYEAWLYAEKKKSNDSVFINVKNQFINWLIDNPKISYFNNDPEEYSKRLDEYNDFFNVNIFSLSSNSYREIIELITKEAYKNKNSEFYKFSKSDSNHRPRAILGKKNYFEFLNEILGSEVNYWLFQGNPKIYNITNALKAGHLRSWKVAAHKDKIKPRDKVIIWQTGENAGCYALAEVTSEVGKIDEASFEMQHYITPQEPSENEDRVQLKITHYNADIPLLSKDLEDVQELSLLKAGNQGTNFTATGTEFNYLKQFIEDQILLQKVCKLFSSEHIQCFYQIRDDIFKNLDVQFGDPRIVNSVTRDRLVFTIGQRYCWTLFGNDKRGAFGLISTKKINSDTEPYSGSPESYFTRFDDFSIALKNIADAIDAMDTELDRSSKSSFDKHNNLALEKSIENLAYRQRLFPNIDFSNLAFAKAKKTMVAPLNQLFYGPPGTGKTYRTVAEAASIINGDHIDDYDKAKTIFQENLGERIEFITFHQNYSYEDFIQGLRPDVANKSLSFERADGIFKKIAKQASFEFYNIYKKRELENLESDTEVIPLKDIYKAFIASLQPEQSFQTISGNTVLIDSISNNNIRFKHYQGGQTYVVSEKRLIKLFSVFDDISKIYNINDDIRSAIGGSNSTVYYVALREFIAFKKKLEENKDLVISTQDKIAELQYEEFDYEQQKEALSNFDLNNLKTISSTQAPSYVIIIDEINRANISRVFGELITLIEPDKRSHGDVPLTVKLPSGERFIVPSNLYIIGTMNTADKSIALLDIALRRRFEFIPMYPDTTIEGVQRADILNKINEQITSIKTRDFTIGHSYFMGKDFTLDTTINNKVIPLLLEYFMNDEEEVIKILKEAGLEVSGWPLKLINELSNA